MKMLRAGALLPATKGVPLSRRERRSHCWLGVADQTYRLLPCLPQPGFFST